MGSKDLKSACKAQGLGAVGMKGASDISTGYCIAKATQCSNTCGDANSKSKAERCSDLMQVGYAVSVKSAAQATQEVVNAKLCEKAVDALTPPSCDKDPNAINRRECTDKYCSISQHKTDPICFAGLCNDPETAKNEPLCYAAFCAEHKDDIRCGGQTKPTDNPNKTSLPSLAAIPTTTGEVALPVLDDDTNGPLYTGNPETKGNPTKYDPNDAPSQGGGGMQPSSGYPGGAQGNGQQQAAAGSAFNTAVDKGFYGGGGGFSVNGVPVEGGGGRGGNGGNGKDDPKIDLSKYLPGGQLDPNKREPAALELRAKGITGANELSNFEKVTRMMNRKRPMLKPAEGR